MNKFFIGALALAATLSSCTKSEVISSEAEVATPGIIGFSTYANANTKGTPVTGNDNFDDVYGTTGFAVSAYVNKDVAGSFDGAYLGENAQIHYTTDWTYADVSQVQYWPDPTSNTGLDFYAVAPFGTTHTITRAGGLTIENYTVSTTDIDSHEDLMYAASGNQILGSGLVSADGEVSLHFKHALTQVRFTGSVVSEKLFVEVKSVSIHNINTAGNFTLASGATTSDAAGSAVGAWTSSTPGSYTSAQADVVTMSNGTVKVLSNDDTPMMLIPQELTPITAGTAVAGASGSYAVIECNAYVLDPADDPATADRIYLMGSEGVYESAVAPLTDGVDGAGSLWQGGNIVTYNIGFTGGYDEDGNKNLIEITFSATADGWDSVNGSVNM